MHNIDPHLIQMKSPMSTDLKARGGARSGQLDWASKGRWTGQLDCEIDADILSS